MPNSMIACVMCLCLTALAGCPDSVDAVEPREACESASTALCARVYACLSPTERTRGGFPDTEAACVLQLEMKEGCAAQTRENVCEGTATYHAATAAKCLDQLDAMSCGQVRTSITAAAPACDQVCAID